MSTPSQEIPDLLGITLGHGMPDRVQLSLRLKAARWLAGGVNGKGQTAALSLEALAEEPELRRNRITFNRLREIEQMRTTVDVRPAEFDKIADVLGLDRQWFAVEDLGLLLSDLEHPADRLEREMREAGDEPSQRQDDDSDEGGEAPGQRGPRP